MILLQGICNIFQQQDTHDLHCDSGIGEVSHIVYVGFLLQQVLREGAGSALPLTLINAPNLCFSKVDQHYRLASVLVGTALGTRPQKDMTKCYSRRMDP